MKKRSMIRDLFEVKPWSLSGLLKIYNANLKYNVICNTMFRLYPRWIEEYKEQRSLVATFVRIRWILVFELSFTFLLSWNWLQSKATKTSRKKKIKNIFSQFNCGSKKWTALIGASRAAWLGLTRAYSGRLGPTRAEHKYTKLYEKLEDYLRQCFHRLRIWSNDWESVHRLRIWSLIGAKSEILKLV